MITMVTGDMGRSIASMGKRLGSVLGQIGGCQAIPKDEGTGRAGVAVRMMVVLP